MRFRFSVRIFAAGMLLGSLAACGGSTPKLGNGTGGGGGGGGSSGGGGGGTTTSSFSMGVLSGGTFTPGVIEIGQSPLAAGGSSGLRVDIVDVNNGNAPLTDTASVTFTSPCVGQGLAQITSPVDTIGGTANSTYKALGCSGDDRITASASVNGTTLTATGTITVQPSALGSIEFVSATPSTIGIRGTGQPETSVVVFRVLNSNGGPVPNQAVNFSLNTSVGGIELSPTTGTTDSTGAVQTTVRSGTVHTAVRVTATTTDMVTGATITSQSELLAITTGIPDQDSFSLSVECFNVEGLNRDGTEAQITTRAADRFNTPVPAGTAVAFTTEGGAIDGNCATGAGSTGLPDGACTVVWRSQNPRPVNLCAAPDPADPSCDNGPRAGRSTVLATAIGEESFTDTNGNGEFDSDPAPGEPFTDLSEAFRDDNENGVRDTNEEFLDFDNNGAFDAPDARFTGLLCNGALCEPTGQSRTLNVRGSLVIVMSGSSPNLRFADISISGGTFDGSTFTIPAGKTAVISFVIRDINFQPMPNSTTIALSATDAGSVLGTSSFSVPCTTDDSALGNLYRFTVKASDPPNPSADKSGTLELKVTVPSGLDSIFQFGLVSDAP